MTHYYQLGMKSMATILSATILKVQTQVFLKLSITVTITDGTTTTQKMATTGRILMEKENIK